MTQNYYLTVLKPAEDAGARQRAQDAAQTARASIPLNPARALSGASVWDKLADCESSGNWAYNGPSGFDGGIQFLPATWSKMGTGYAYAWQAPREVQIAAGMRLQAQDGWGQWPACARKLGLM